MNWGQLFNINEVNDSLKFQMAILQIHCYFLLKKRENHTFSTKNNSVFAFEVDI